MTCTAVQQPCRAVTAHIEKHLYHPVLPAHRDQGLAQEIQSVVIAGIRYVVEMAYHLPRGGEYPLLLGRQEIRVAIYPSGETEPFQAGGDLRGYIVVQ